MIDVKFRGERDLYKALIRIERNIERTTGEFLRFAAEWLRNDIRSNWSSAPAPSNSGEAPAYDTDINTGNLDTSIFMEQQGRSSGGQFSSLGGAMTWYVRVDTAKGTNPKRRGGYAQALETGTSRMNARPFMRPAIDRLSSVYEELAKRYIKV